MICKKCSADVPDDGIYCPVCGSRADGNKICPNCQKLIPENSIFCTYCGAKTVDNKPVNVETETPKVLPQEEINIQENNEILVPVANPVASSNDTSDEENCDEIEDVAEVQVNKDSIKTNNYTDKDYSGDDFLRYFELPKEIDDKTFYANTLTHIALDKNSPEDVFVIGKFEPVRTEYRQYVLGKGTAQMAYSATIGYDRKVEYQEYNKSFNDYQTKTKTVTDWKPFSGVHTGEYIKATTNYNSTDYFGPDDYKDKCAVIAKPYDPSTSTAPAPLEPSSVAINSLKDSIKASAEFDCKSKLPGDKNKDFKCDGVVSLTRVESHVVPQYILKYRYLDKEYTLKGFSCKKSVIRGDIPSAKSDIEAEIEDNVYVKTFNIITLFTLLFSIISSIYFPIAVKIIFALLGVTSFIIYWVIRSNVSGEIYYSKTFKKKNDLIAHLKRKGIAIPSNLRGGTR